MTPPLESLKTELERFGESNDRSNSERARRMLNISRDTGELLSVLVRATAVRQVLEIGTSNGYSTLWLAEAAKATGGMVTTLEASEYKIGLASVNFERSGLSSHINLVHGDAGLFLKQAKTGTFDFIFLDSERSQYAEWWTQIRRVLRPGGLLVADNAVSHVNEIAPLVELVTKDGAFTSCLVPVGKGEFIAVKAKD